MANEALEGLTELELFVQRGKTATTKLFAEGWAIEVELELTPSTVLVRQVVLMSVRDDESGASITSNVIRDLPWGEIFAMVRASLNQESGFWLAHAVYGPIEEALAELEAQAGTARGALFHLRRAVLYLEFVSRGAPSPIDEVAKRHGVKHATAANWIKQARKRGLLGSAGPGRPGGTLTPAAIALAKEAVDG